MQFAKITPALAAAAALVLISAVASAQLYNKRTNLTVKETIEVPGAVLPPGEYVVKLVDSQSNRHIVQFLSEDENEVLSTIIAIPNTRLEPTGETQFMWHETPAGQPPALKAWFYPGDNFGQEFAYPEGRATELSAATHQEVAHVSDQEAAAAANQGQNRAANQEQATSANQEQSREETAVAQAPRTQPDANERQTAQREREMAAQRERDAQLQRDRELEIAQASQNEQRNADRNLTAQQVPQPQSQSQFAQGELPRTAGFGALLALIGLGSLGASWGLRKLRSK